MAHFQRTSDREIQSQIANLQAQIDALESMNQPVPPPSEDKILYYKLGITELAWLSIGSGLQINDGVLVVNIDIVAILTAVAEAEAFANEAEAWRDEAAAYALQVSDDVYLAEQAKLAAQAAAVEAEGWAASGPIDETYATHAAMQAALGAHANGDVVYVFADEDMGGYPAWYERVAGAWVWRQTVQNFRNIFVGSSGSDSDSGFTIDEPLLTMAAAIAKLHDGDTLYRLGNSVFREDVDISSLDNVRLLECGEGAPSIISGYDVVAPGDFVNVSGDLWSFTKTLPIAAANRGYPAVYKNGVRLSEIIVGDPGVADATAADAAVGATPLSMYFAGPGGTVAGWAAGAKTIRINPGVGIDPTTEPSGTYEVAARQGELKIGDNYVSGGRVHLGLSHNGVSGGGCPKLRGMKISRIARHAVLLNNWDIQDCLIGDSNPRYPGALLHCNPSTEQGASTYKNMTIVGDPDAPAQQGLFSHGGGAGVVIKDLSNYIDTNISNVVSAISLAEVRTAMLYGLRARKFTFLWGGSAFQSDGYIYNADVRGGGGISSRIVQIPAGKFLRIYKSYFDILGRYFLSQAASSHAGELSLNDTTIILRPTFNSGDYAAFARVESHTTHDIGKLEILNCILISLGEAMEGYLCSANAITEFNIDEVLVAGIVTSAGVPNRTTLYRKDGTGADVTLETGVGRVLVIDASRIVESDAENGVRLRYGTWQPGMKIFSGIANPGGSTQPRAYIMVGDVIAKQDNNSARGILVHTPTSHLNAVCFSLDGATACFVAVGNDGLIVKSDTVGTVWAVKGAAVTTEHLRAVAANLAGDLVAVGDNGTVLISVDQGETWTVEVSGTAQHLYAVATSDVGGADTAWLFAGAAGITAQAATADLTTWVTATVGSIIWRAMIWDDVLNFFYLGGDDGNLRSAPNGTPVTWTSRTSNTLNRIVSFAFGPDGALAALYQTAIHTTCFLTSTNGTTWTPDEDTVMPFEVRAVAGAKASIFESRSWLCVGESEFVGYARLINGPWELNRVTAPDGDDAQYNGISRQEFLLLEAV